MVKKVILGLFLFTFLMAVFIYLRGLWKSGEFRSPVSLAPKEKPLDKYTYDSLRQRQYPASVITLGETVKEGKGFRTKSFNFFVDGKKVTGLANFPSVQKSKYPLVIMFRGYVDKDDYKSGDGTRHAGEFFASQDLATIAPDFLGYGGSDPSDPDTLKARFETYITAVTLINSVGLLPFVDADRIFIWGHSNGGQVALSALEITGAAYPTVLWAPVSKPFPYSVLFYSDEASDSGKAMRMVVAEFDRNYDAQKYSLTNYLDWISAPILVQQGVGDDTVLPRWSRELGKKLKELNKEVKYLEYGGDHNFVGSWNKVVADDLNFFNYFLR